MSFDTPNGTHGARQPRSGPFYTILNGMVMNRVRRRGGKIMGLNALVLTTVGRTSGVKRSTPVAWFPGSDESWLIVASANGGPKNPAWYYNLSSSPENVQIELAGKKFDVTADELHGPDREAAWGQIIAASPRFGKYQEHTDRKYPVIRLTEQSHATGSR